MEVTIEDIKKAIEKADLMIDDLSGLDESKSLTDQGLDSLDIMAVFLELEEKYSIKVPDDDYQSIQSIMEIKNYFNQRLQNG